MAATVGEAALRLLARREHSVFELTRKLGSRGFSREDIEREIVDLVARGLLSDGRFAEEYVAMRRRKGFGPARINAELRERGLDRELIAEHLGAEDDPWQALCRKTRRKKFGEAPPADAKDRAKQQRYLAQRGFSSGQISASFSANDD